MPDGRTATPSSFAIARGITLTSAPVSSSMRTSAMVCPAPATTARASGAGGSKPSDSYVGIERRASRPAFYAHLECRSIRRVDQPRADDARREALLHFAVDLDWQ